MVQRSHENMNLNKNKLKPRVNYADTTINCDTFLLHHLAHVIVLWQMKKNVRYCTFLLCFVLHLRAISKDKPPDLIVAGAILRRPFFVPSLRGF